VGNVSKHGFWLLVGERELFLAFKDFPWFEDVPIGKLLNLELLHSRHLYWPDLDVDLSLESIEHPERFPLVSHARPGKPLPQRARARSADSGLRRARRTRRG
jgi:hypothetical protein